MEPKLLLTRWLELAGVVSWLASCLYGSIPLFWFAIHPFAARWRRMQRSPYLWLVPLWAMIFAALVGLSWPWRETRIYSTPWTGLPALALFVFGFNTYRRIGSEFGTRKLSGEAELRPEEHEQRLVTTGLHARIRHPIYLAHLCNMAGCALLSGLLVPFLLLAISAFVTFPLMIWLEEGELEKRFGQQFRDYKKTVPLVPGFFSTSHAASNASKVNAALESQKQGFLETSGKRP